MSLTAKITSKGQITIPKAIREILDSDVVEFQLVNDQIILKPVNSVGGALNKYAKNTKSIHEVRETVWEQIVNDKVKG